MKTFKIHLIRHGFTEANSKGLYLGHTDSPLSSEAERELCTLKELGGYPEVSHILSSPLKRALVSAHILYPELTPAPVEDLIEYDFGEFEGRSAKDLFESSPLFERWLKGEKGISPPFGESNEEFASRVCSCFVKIVDGCIKNEIENLLIVTHGGVICTILSNCALPEAHVHEWATKPGHGYTLLIQPDIWLTHRKAEVIEQIPQLKKRKYYDGWDYYADNDDYDISKDVYEDFDPLIEGYI